MVVPTLYAASDLDGALSETVFRSVPVRGPEKRIGRFVLEPLVASVVVCVRDLILAQLFGHGLRRLGVTRLELIETDAEEYPRTIAWARALHTCGQRIDGLIWVSRQNDGTHSLMLFGDRVPTPSLGALQSPVPLWKGPGYEEVQRAADLAGIMIFE